jgi:hypothetical protein
MKSKITLKRPLLVLVSVLLAFTTLGFLADRAWATQVTVEGSCEQVKNTCPKGGYTEGPADDRGYRACMCYTPCGGKAQGCDVICRARPGEIVNCVGHTPDGILQSTQGRKFSPAQILREVPSLQTAPTIMRRGVEGEQPDTGMANPSDTSPETK